MKRYLLVQALPGVLCHEAEQCKECPREGIKAGVVKIRIFRCFQADVTTGAVTAARGERSHHTALLIGCKGIWGGKKVKGLRSELSSELGFSVGR